jgi:peptidoglycan/xylan/chitin deacetylase (PgdA/CDA1 family)
MHWQQQVRRIAKLALVWPAYYAGVLELLRHRIMRRRAVILMYHRVIGPETRLPDYSPNGMAVTPQQFARQMRFVASRYRVVPLSELVANVQQPAHRFVPNLCAITFDDGWRDVYVHALPVLRQHALPATVFLTTNFVDRRTWFWEERVKYVLAHIWSVLRIAGQDGDRAVLQELEAFGNRLGLSAVHPLGLGALPHYLDQVVRRMQEWPPPDRAHWMSRIESILQRAPFVEPRLFLEWDEIREMARHGIEFGNHTMTHRNLAALPEEEVVAELRGAAERIQDSLGCPVANIAYPYGKHVEATKQIVRDLKVDSACTTRLGLVGPGDDRYSLKRINVHADVSACDAAFAARLLNF